MLVRYLILIGILIICAGAAYFLANASDVHQENAVLALYKVNFPEGVADI